MTARDAAGLLRAARAEKCASDEGAMTQAQASALKYLAEQAFEPEAFNCRLTKAEAWRRIEALAAKLRLEDGPPHTL